MAAQLSCHVQNVADIDLSSLRNKEISSNLKYNGRIVSEMAYKFMINIW